MNIKNDSGNSKERHYLTVREGESFVKFTKRDTKLSILDELTVCECLSISLVLDLFINTVII